MPEQEVRKPQKKKQEPVYHFDAGKVFTPADAKAGDLQDPVTDQNSAIYRAQHGQGGTRRKYPR